MSAADANDVNEIAIADTSDVELESVNEADLLSDNANRIELSTRTNSTIDENNINNEDANKEVYTSNEDTTSNNAKVTPIINVDDVIIKNGADILIPFNVTDNEGKLIPRGAIVTLSWENNTVNQYVELENGKGLANFSAELLIGKVSDNNNTIDLSKLYNDIINFFNLNNTSESSSEPINTSEKPVDISNLFNITLPDIFNITCQTIQTYLT